MDSWHPSNDTMHPIFAQTLGIDPELPGSLIQSLSEPKPRRDTNMAMNSPSFR